MHPHELKQLLHVGRTSKELLVMCLQNNGGPGLQGRKLCRNWDWIN